MLPSNKASIVMPLLARLPKNETTGATQKEIDRILGKGEPRGVVGGTPTFSCGDIYWYLDDKTEIHEAYVGPNFSLSARTPDGKVVSLYSSPKASNSN